MKRVQKIIVAMISSCMMFMMAACAQAESFDAKGYTEALMVMITTGDQEKLVSLGMPEEEAKSAYEGLIVAMQNEVSSQLEEFEVSDKTRDIWNEMLIKMFKVSKYSIDDAKEIENGYSVDIHITPILFSEMSEDDAFMSALQDKVLEAYESKEINMDEIYDYTFYHTADMLIKELDHAKYGEECVVTVTYEKNSEGKYEIKDELDTGIQIGSSLFK